MQLRATLYSESPQRIIPINYQYPLSSAIYKVLSRADTEYADFLHQTGYGKGFKLFTFSDIRCPFKIQGDRMHLLSQEIELKVSFHLPEATQNFIKGLFLSQKIEITDKKSKAGFTVTSVESLPNPLQQHKDNEVINVQLKPLSPVVVGLQNDKGNYDFLSPEDDRFVESIIYNWRNKISSCYDEATASGALLMMEVVSMEKPHSRERGFPKVRFSTQLKKCFLNSFNLKHTWQI